MPWYKMIGGEGFDSKCWPATICPVWLRLQILDTGYSKCKATMLMYLLPDVFIYQQSTLLFSL